MVWKMFWRMSPLPSASVSVMAKPGAFGFMISTRTCWSFPTSGFVLLGLL